jgi:hypothetical protein
MAACAAFGLCAQSCGVFSSSTDCAGVDPGELDATGTGAEAGGGTGTPETGDRATGGGETGGGNTVDRDTSGGDTGGSDTAGGNTGGGDTGVGDTAGGATGGDTGGGDRGTNGGDVVIIGDTSFEVATGAEDATSDQGATQDAATDTTATESSEAGDSAVVASACGLPSPLPSKGLLYDGAGAAATCSQTISAADYPGNFWFSYSDGTQSGAPFVHTADFGGCDGPTDCAFHAMGSGYTGYGAGVGFTLNGNGLFDASGYSGVEVWLRGTTSGTRAAGWAKQDDSVHVKFLTGSTDASTTDPRQGDDYGAYCSTVEADGGVGGWVMCRLAFVSLTRDGFRGADAGAPDPATDRFDPQNLVKIEFEFSSYTPPDGGTPGPVGFDVWIDDVAFF